MSIGLSFSKDLTLHPVKIPIEKLTDYSYTILDSYEGTIFLNINHYGKKSKVGNVYVSDYHGTKFTLSLLNNFIDIDSG